MNIRDAIEDLEAIKMIPDFELKTVRLFNCDCMDFMSKIPDNFYELAIVDPPYGIESFKNLKENNNRIQKIFRKSENYNNATPSIEYFEELFRISRKQIIWGANNFNLPPTEYFLIWNKEQTVDNFASAEYAWTNCKMPAKVFTYSIHKHNHTNKIHPTQKPIALYEWILSKYAKSGDKIFDSHGGSFPSAYACMNFDFDFDGCEIDREYFDNAVERLKNNVQEYFEFA